MARPKKQLTESQKKEVVALAQFLTQEQIADYLGISVDTFSRICECDEGVLRNYKKGKAKVIRDVAKGLISRAKSGDTASAIFYLKTQAGWSESKSEDKDIAPPLNITFTVNKAVDDVKVTNASA